MLKMFSHRWARIDTNLARAALVLASGMSTLGLPTTRV